MYRLIEVLDNNFYRVVIAVRIALGLIFTFAVFEHYGLLLGFFSLLILVLSEIVWLKIRELTDLSEAFYRLSDQVDRMATLLSTASRYIHQHEEGIRKLQIITEFRRKQTK